MVHHARCTWSTDLESPHASLPLSFWLAGRYGAAKIVGGTLEGELHFDAAAVEAAILAAPQDLDALKQLAPEIFSNCKARHEDYRIPGE